MSLSQILHLATADLQKVNENIIRCLESDVAMIQQIGHYLVGSGGKRIRPLVLLLTSRACGVTGENYITMAGVIEFIHTATLLHDDVVDGSKLRRGRLTANRVWDNPSAILVGDFLYTRAFQMMVTVNSMHAMAIMAEATNVISEGEVLQLTHRFQPDVTELSYLTVIKYKTAKLFEAAAQIGAVMAKQPRDVEQALANYGLHLGMAFQLIDDMLDYRASADVFGKNIGDDLAEGKATLPLIYALKQANLQEAEFIRQTIKAGKVEDLDRIQAIINSTGAVEYTMQAAKHEIQLALEALKILPPSVYRDALAQLAEFAITRGS